MWGDDDSVRGCGAAAAAEAAAVAQLLFQMSNGQMRYAPDKVHYVGSSSIGYVTCDIRKRILRTGSMYGIGTRAGPPLLRKALTESVEKSKIPLR